MFRGRDAAAGTISSAGGRARLAAHASLRPAAYSHTLYWWHAGEEIRYSIDRLARCEHESRSICLPAGKLQHRLKLLSPDEKDGLTRRLETTPR
jgi:hypothetical protein